MPAMHSSMSPKGQVTIPVEIRRLLGLKPKDQVYFTVKNGSVFVERAPSIDDVYISVPPLRRALSDQEMTQLAAEEHVQHVAHEDRDS